MSETMKNVKRMTYLKFSSSVELSERLDSLLSVHTGRHSFSLLYTQNSFITSTARGRQDFTHVCWSVG